MVSINITQRRMYITGGVGSTEHGESFTVDYDLPNDTIYGETCASVALMMFASRMAALNSDGRHYDIVERAFFNQVLGGIAQTGTTFFYVGPLCVQPDRCAGNPGLVHVKPTRQKWYDVACCPTNIARTIMNIAAYALGQEERRLCIHIPIACQINTDLFALHLHTRYPFSNTLEIEVKERRQHIAIRKSDLAPITKIALDGSVISPMVQNGYYLLDNLAPQSHLLITYDLTPHHVVSHPPCFCQRGQGGCDARPACLLRGAGG